MLKMIGFDRYIDLRWLDTLASLLSHSTRTDSNLEYIRNSMHDMFKEEYPYYEARKKTVSVLTRIWVRIPEQHKQLQQQAMRLYESLRPADRIWIHWGMILVAYPFFRDIALIIGRLLSLEGEVISSQIRRRVEREWGPRTTLIRAIDRVLQSMNAWKVMHNIQSKNSHIASKFNTNNNQIKLWLLKTVLISESVYSMQLQRLLKSPSIFYINVSRYDIQRAATFQYSKESLDSEILSLRE
jgi:hypothetical protein